MQIILMEKVVNLGGLGDVVKVKDGYARNYLIPQGKAKRAELEKAQADSLAAAQSLAEKIEGLMVQITRKAGVDGRLFGSVGNADIAEVLKTQGFEVEKSAVRLPQGPFKAVGDNQVEVALHTDVVATITVSILGEHA